MSEATIGITLPNREWNRLLKKKKSNRKKELREYGLIGKEYGFRPLFFTLDSVNLTALTCNAIDLNDGEPVEIKGEPLPFILYNPKKLIKKGQIKTWRSLSENKKFKVINEHHVIKLEHLTELLRSNPDFKKYISQDYELAEEYVCLGQKTNNKNWEITADYAVHVNDGGGMVFATDQESTKTETKIQIKNTAINILSFISNYYPGIDEIALIFSITPTSDYYFCDVKSKFKVLKELEKANMELWKKVLAFPFQNASRNLESSYWVIFKVFDHTEPILRIPSSIAPTNSNENIEIKLGIKTVHCKIEPVQTRELAKNSSYHSPIELFISSDLVDLLTIPIEQLTYQMIVKDKRIEIGPTIGFLLGDKNQLYHPIYMKKYSDRFGDYSQIGGVTIAFSIRSIDWENNTVYGLIYDPLQKEWGYGSMAIPSVIYRRNFHQDDNLINTLKERTNNGVFNSTRFTKLDLNNLQNRDEIKDYVPETEILTDFSRLLAFVERVPKTILKPINLSRGRGIFILERTFHEEYKYRLIDYRKKNKAQHQIQDSDALFEMMKSFNLFNGQYLFQPFLPLLKVNGRVLDVRVVMQKNEQFIWQCTGIECRVAGEGEQITNIARGGTAMTLQHVVETSGLKTTYDKVLGKVLTLCLNFCKMMDSMNEHYAEFGIDVGLDEDGFPWLIESNVFPCFKGFKKMDYNTYLEIRNQPLIYATSLQGFKVFKEELFDEGND